MMNYQEVERIGKLLALATEPEIKALFALWYRSNRKVAHDYAAAKIKTDDLPESYQPLVNLIIANAQNNEPEQEGIPE